ncbi:MAG: Fic family protein, partial [Ferruginibacter sp.]|nr:Fic family protein [Rhodoferax sp.]
MAKQISTAVGDAILTALGAFPDGALIEQLEAQLLAPPNRRTLQRWLLGLIAHKRLFKTGQGRATRYVCTLPPPPASEAAVQEHALPLSASAQSIEAQVRLPLQQRTPVGYQQAFLDTYRPNTTFYLPASTRAELLSSGQAMVADTPAGTYARQIAQRLLIDLSWNSSRLEGNTYSLLETERLLSVGAVARGKNAMETQMLVNHKEAIEFLIASASEIGFNRYTVLNLHALLADNLLEDPTASGRLRRIAVGIGRTVFHPLEGPQRIEACFAQVLDTASAIEDPFEQAFFAMVHLPYLQPFEDVNKRVSRLAANIPLIRRNLCPLSFVDVPQALYTSAMLGIYELNRVELLRDVFVWAYKRSCARYSAVRQSLGEPDPFRVQYRALVAQVVAEVVRAGLDKTHAIAYVHSFAQTQVPVSDGGHFIEVAETELMSLHEGNIARYRVRPSEYQHWQA